MRFVPDYDRKAAVRYAHRWAYGRNPAFYDYEELGGDCTNFASQCVFAGSRIMNFTPTYGWYYIDANQKAPAWTGVEYFWNFMTRRSFSLGPVGEPCEVKDLRPGDIVQLRLKESGFQHSPVVVFVGQPAVPENILLAAHSYDADNRPLSTYDYKDIRCLHITGTIRP
ncbi:MAG: amidase domain-containing protein [Clostridia bacterium]|nr:amidase domain-containing protein [Clostridia bacterium]